MFGYLLIGFLLTVSVAYSSCDEGQREYMLFNSTDVNRDDQLTRVELDNVFYLFDSNKDSTITPTEFVADWTQTFDIGGTQEAQTLFTRADTNDDGVIDARDLPAIFAYFDMDGNGLVSINEFLTQIHVLEEEPTDEGNATVDLDG